MSPIHSSLLNYNWMVMWLLLITSMIFLEVTDWSIFKVIHLIIVTQICCTHKSSFWMGLSVGWQLMLMIFLLCKNILRCFKKFNLTLKSVFALFDTWYGFALFDTWSIFAAIWHWMWFLHYLTLDIVLYYLAFHKTNLSKSGPDLSNLAHTLV